MVTTFFGAHSFGGDAAYVDRLSRALCRRGDEVHVYYCLDAWRAVRGDFPPRSYTPPPELHIHPIESRLGLLSPLATQATGMPWGKTKVLSDALDDPDIDLIHFHNISLVGGPAVLGLGSNRRAVRLMTAHEHWLICPMHLLWKNDRQVCDRATCVTCCLRGRRPPQVWRLSRAIERGLGNLDALVFPSQHALAEHRRRGLGAFVPLVHLPYFLPDDWTGGVQSKPRKPRARPYLAAAGRLVKMKGFQTLIPLMRYLPEADLVIAGTGPFEPVLREIAHDLPNVRFEGLLGGRALAQLFCGARAVVVPSLFPETFGYVVLEAFAVGTPVVVHEGGGALAETAIATGGGLGYRSDIELLTALRRLLHDEELHQELAASGLDARHRLFSEARHLKAYDDLIARARSERAGTSLAGPHARPTSRQPRPVPD
jgi:glycosyltransferase involved in cell wall biosynthesis